jgi:hypothetical protein
MGYCFLKKATDGVPATLTVLVMTDVRTGCIGAIALRQKGVDRAAIDYPSKWFETLGYRRLVLHTGSKSSIVELAKAILAKFTAKFDDDDRRKVQLTRRESPVESHQSLGAGERANQTVEGLWRATRTDLEESLNKKLKVTGSVLAWPPQCVAWCCNRYQPTKADKKTPYERLTLKTYDRPLATLGEKILTCVVPVSKAQAQWLELRSLDWEKPCARRARDFDGGERTPLQPGSATTCAR